MWQRLDLETPEAAAIQEPITLDDVKLHLRETTYDGADDYINSLIARARNLAEATTRRALVARTATLVIPYLPHRFSLPYGKAQSVTSIVYIDTAGASQTLTYSASPTPFQVDLSDEDGALVRPNRNAVWPTVDTESIAPVTITWEAGYGDPTDVPHLVRHAIALQVARWYEHRGDDGEALSDEFLRTIMPYCLV